MADIKLIKLTEQLIDIPSVSFSEGRIADFIFEFLSECSHLKVQRIGNCIIAENIVDGREATVCLAGHIDTVPPNNNDKSHYSDQKLYGLGAADMKGGIAVMLKLAVNLVKPHFNLKFIFYPCEEVDNKHNGLRQLHEADLNYLSCDSAILLEPTNGIIEAGCQGVVKLKILVKGKRSHSARPWMGLNAIHRSYKVIQGIADFKENRPIVDSLEFRETFQAVLVSGGIATNVVPDESVITASYRFAPNKNSDEAVEYIKNYLGLFIESSLGDKIEVLDVADAAYPGISNPILNRIVSVTKEVRPKLGWTDVAFFSKLNVPAINFGPGDSSLAHSEDEYVTDVQLCNVYDSLFKSLEN